MELLTDLSLGLDSVGPVHNRAVARAAPVRGDLLEGLQEARTAITQITFNRLRADDLSLRREQFSIGRSRMIIRRGQAQDMAI
jgi:hypothetical protein